MKILKTKKYRILSVILKYSFVAIFAVMLLAPVLFVNAEMGTGTSVKTTINNPLGDNIKDIPSFIKAIIDIVVLIGVPIVTLAIIYSGFLFVKAQGNPEQLTNAKKTLLYTLIGAALLLGAFVIAVAIGSTVDDITSTT